MSTAFNQLGLSPFLLDSVRDLGFIEPTEIQARTIPAALAGKDLAGLSQTGSGKTAAFALPALESLDLSRGEPQVLILAPTRELAVQICADVHLLGGNLNGLRAVPVYGGAGIDQQIRQLKKGVHLVVGTPGRLLDHLRRKTLKLAAVQMVVLDEADRMLDMGFQEEMDTLLEALPEHRQMLFFSATMNKAVEKLIRRHGNEPVTIATERKVMTVGTVEQWWYEVGHGSKIEVLARILFRDRPRLAMVFCNTRLRVDEVTESLIMLGFSADRLHGDLSQQMRERVLGRFRRGNVKILVATDVAARGLDVENVELAVNFDLPADPEDYVHRIGRTGRAGRAGCAISFVAGRELRRLRGIERFIKHEIVHAEVPTPDELVVRQQERLLQRIEERLKKTPEPAGVASLERLQAEGMSWKVLAGTLLDLLGESEVRPCTKIPEDQPRTNHELRDVIKSGAFPPGANEDLAERKANPIETVVRAPTHGEAMMSGCRRMSLILAVAMAYIHQSS